LNTPKKATAHRAAIAGSVPVYAGTRSNLKGLLIAEIKNIKIGNGFEDGVLLGPLVSHAQREKVMTAIGFAVNEGVKLSHRGKAPKGFNKGFYLEPTIFSDVAVESAIWNEDVFGPVVCLRSFKGEAEAIALANQS
jgi:betaine-aldehyde dehydrogenase